MFKILKSKQNSDATIFYMDIIKRGIVEAGFEATDAFDSSDIKGNDVVTLNPPQYVRMKLKGAKNVSVWFQGIDAEEYLHYGPVSRFKKIERYIVLSIYEWIALKRAKVCFFVSKRMLEHYRKKYGYKKNNYVIMPCFNDRIKDDAFIDLKYKEPSFVYAGNLAGWQCFPETVELFKNIKAKIPNATLTIYSPDQDEAKKILGKKGVSATVKYVPYTQLAEEIKEFKYGFLIREDHPVNNVATPTKMCNYLANGIIPVYSNVIGDFKEELKDLYYAVPLGSNYEGIEKLYELEKREIIASNVRRDFQNVFDTYYSVLNYVNIISKIIRG